MPRHLALLSFLTLAACGGNYSADTYATRAVQQVNKVEQGVIVGSREVAIAADGAAGAAVGGAAGGIVGAATPGSNLTSALAGVGGGLVGGLFGSATERVIGDNRGTEYIVRKPNGELVNVTQRDVPPLPIGTKVLVIAGAQARLVQDYTVPGVGTPGAPSPGSPAPLEGPVRADPPTAGTAPVPDSPARSDLPPLTPSSAGEAPPSPRAPLSPPDAPLAL